MTVGTPLPLMIGDNSEFSGPRRLGTVYTYFPEGGRCPAGTGSTWQHPDPTLLPPRHAAGSAHNYSDSMLSLMRSLLLASLLQRGSKFKRSGTGLSSRTLR
jgi:hypothetical protein